MSLKISAANIASAIGARQSDVENWITRLELSVPIEPTVPGHARTFSRRNALELAFIAAFVSAGARPSTAAAYAASFLRQERVGKVREWIIFPSADGAATAVGAQALSLDRLAAMAEKASPPAVSIIQLGEIVRRVDRLYGLGD